MTEYIVTAAILFAISFSLMIFYSKKLLWKLTTVATMFLLANLIYFTFDTLKGWPTVEHLPRKGQLIWAIVNEPKENDPGSIYLWVVYDTHSDEHWFSKYFTYQPDASSPRSFSLPYSKQSAQKVDEAQQALQEGFTVEFESDGNSLLDPVSNNADAKNSGESAGGEMSGLIDTNTPRFTIIDPRERMGKGN